MNITLKSINNINYYLSLVHINKITNTYSDYFSLIAYNYFKIKKIINFIVIYLYII